MPFLVSLSGDQQFSCLFKKFADERDRQVFRGNFIRRDRPRPSLECFLTCLISNEFVECSLLAHSVAPAPGLGRVDLSPSLPELVERMA